MLSCASPLFKPLVGGAGILFLLLPVNLATEAPEHVEHEPDHDEVDADIEDRRGDELDVAEDGERRLEERRGEGIRTEEKGGRRRARREEHARAEESAGIDRDGGAQLVAAAREIA